jgi:hypothetical protein
MRKLALAVSVLFLGGCATVSAIPQINKTNISNKTITGKIVLEKERTNHSYCFLIGGLICDAADNLINKDNLKILIDSKSGVFYVNTHNKYKIGEKVLIRKLNNKLIIVGVKK